MSGSHGAARVSVHLGPQVHGPQAEAQRRAQEVDEGHLTLLEVAHHAAMWRQVLLASDIYMFSTNLVPRAPSSPSPKEKEFINFNCFSLGWEW